MLFRSPQIISDYNQALDVASAKTSVSRKEWISNGDMTDRIRQKTLSDFI